ncbi:MAG: hypothetical protein QOE80_3791 [Actinomycetota bacterium]|nr:hypothetical protein [Actinomycetota bacterium]
MELSARGMGGVPPTRAAGAAKARGMGGVPPTRAAGAARDRDRRLAVVALLVIVLAAGIGTLGAVLTGFTFI